MRAVLRKLRSDLRTNRVQRVFIVLLLALATAALTTSVTVQARGGTAWEDLFREANGAHAWFYGNSAQLGDVAARPEVKATAGPYQMTSASDPSVVAPGGRPLPVWLQAVGTEPPAIDRPIVVSGRWLDADNEVVLPRKFAADNGYKPGSTITVATSHGTSELKVVGTAVFAGRSPFSFPILAWTTPGTLTGPLTPDFSGLGIQLESRGQVRAFRDALGITPDSNEFFLVEDWNGVRAQNDEATAVIVTFLGIFSLFALISAGFVIVNAISGRVLARYRDIGLLKAIGFTPRQIVIGLLVEQVGLAGIAAGVGIALGTWMVPLLDDPAGKEFATGSYGFFNPLVAFAVFSWCAWTRGYRNTRARAARWPNYGCTGDRLRPRASRQETVQGRRPHTKAAGARVGHRWGEGHLRSAGSKLVHGRGAHPLRSDSDVRLHNRMDDPRAHLAARTYR